MLEWLARIFDFSTSAQLGAPGVYHSHMTPDEARRTQPLPGRCWDEASARGIRYITVDLPPPAAVRVGVEVAGSHPHVEVHLMGEMGGGSLQFKPMFKSMSVGPGSPHLYPLMQRHVPELFADSGAPVVPVHF